VPKAERRLMAVRNRRVAENEHKGWSRNYEGKVEISPTTSKKHIVADTKAAHLAYDELDAIDEKLMAIVGPEKWKWLQGSFGVGAKTRTQRNLRHTGFALPLAKTERSLDEYYDQPVPSTHSGTGRKYVWDKDKQEFVLPGPNRSWPYGPGDPFGPPLDSVPWQQRRDGQPPP